GSLATSLLRASAPSRTPSPFGSIPASGNRLTSIRSECRSAPSFIRSISPVPPARKVAPTVAAAYAAAAPEVGALTYWNGFIPGVSQQLTRLAVSVADVSDRGDDVGVGSAAADVAAHPLTDRVVGRSPFLEERDGGDDLAGRAVATLERVPRDE